MAQFFNEFSGFPAAVRGSSGHHRFADAPGPGSKVDTHKICILGDFAVGKTSLVGRFIHNQFSDRYHTSIGVKVDIKRVDARDGGTLKLAIWDVAGTNTPTEFSLRYVRGASGYFLVADGTRAETLDRALELREAIESQAEGLPFVGLINKADASDEQEIDEETIKRRLDAGETWLRTSARTGDNLDRAFDILLQRIEAEK